MGAVPSPRERFLPWSLAQWSMAMAGLPPDSGRGRSPSGTAERLLLGLAFVASGAALGSWAPAFQLIGAALVLIGLLILVLAGWKPLQGYLQETLGPRAGNQWLVSGLGLIAITVLVAALWWRVSHESTISCIEAAGSCVLTAEMREPGIPLVWNLPRSLTNGQADGALQADARLAGDVAGQYVALGCRSS